MAGREAVRHADGDAGWRVRVRRVGIRVRVNVRCFVVYSNVAEGGGRKATSGLWLEGRLCSMLSVMLDGDLDVVTRSKPGSTDA